MKPEKFAERYLQNEQAGRESIVRKDDKKPTHKTQRISALSGANVDKD